MKFIDSHIHLQDYKQKCATDIIASAHNIGIKKLICASVVEKDWAEIATLYSQYRDVIVPAFGLHPWYINQAQIGWEQRLATNLAQYPTALVGETGFDMLHETAFAPQVTAFLIQANLACQYHRPLIIHAVKAQSWLEKYWSELPPKFVMHSYNGKIELLKQAIKVGGYISFSASILNNPHHEEIIRTVPADKLLVETDGPYQSPQKGQETELSFIPKLVAHLSEIRGEDGPEMASQIYQNSLEFIKPW